MQSKLTIQCCPLLANRHDADEYTVLPSAR